MWESAVAGALWERLWGSGGVPACARASGTHVGAEEQTGRSAGVASPAAPSCCQHLVTSAVTWPYIERQRSGHDLWGSEPWEITSPISSPLTQ